MRSKNVIDLRKKKPKTAAPSSAQRQLPLPAPVARRKRESLHARRRRIQLWGVLGSVCAILVLTAGIIYTSYLPQFNVQRVDVSGASQVSAATIASYATAIIKNHHQHVFSSSNIFLYNPQNVSSALTAHFAPIQSAQVSRESLLSTTVHITIVERAPFAKWCEGDASSSACYALDTAGVVFSSVDPSISFPSPYVFAGGLTAATGTAGVIGSVFAQGHFSGIQALLDLLAQQNFAPQGATVVNDTDFTIPLARGFYIKASYGESAETVANNLQLVLSSDALKEKQDQLEYVDLRFGDRVYYKLKEASSL